MKRLRKQEQERPQGLDGTARHLAKAQLALVVGGDLYMQNPRGSNDRPPGSGG